MLKKKGSLKIITVAIICIIIIILGLFLFNYLENKIKDTNKKFEIRNQSSQWLTLSNEPGFFPIIIDKNSQKTKICIASYTAIDKKHLDDLDFKKADISSDASKAKIVKISAEQIKASDSKLYQDYYGYCYTISANEKYLKFGKNSTILIYDKLSNIEYSTSNYNITQTLKKSNGQEYVQSPKDLFTNNSDANKLKSGAIDYNPLNNTEGALNAYLYEWNSTKEIKKNSFGYYLEESPSIFKKISQFFGSTSQDITYIDTNDICSNSYSNCQFSLSQDNKFLNVTFYSKVINGTVLIDPAYSVGFTSTGSSSLIYTNSTEGSNLGARLSASVLSMDFNSPSESTGTNLPTIKYVKDNSIYNNFGNITQGTGLKPSSIGTATVPNNITANWTINVWLYRTGSSDANANIFEVGTYTANTGFGMWAQAGSIGYRVKQAYNPVVTGITASTWEMWTLKQEGSNLFFYKNGVNVANVTSINAPTGSTNAYLGKRGDTVGTFAGYVDEASLWDRGLTNDEITTLYNSSNGIYGSNTISPFNNSLVAGYHFDEAGTSFADYSGAGRTISSAGTNLLMGGKILSELNTIAPVYNSTGGISGSGAYQFDGVDDYITITDSSNLQPSVLSVCGWAYGNKSGAILHKGRNTAGGYRIASYQIYISSGKFVFYVNKDDSNAAAETSNVLLNNWNYFCGVYNSANSSMLLYSNGILVNNTPTLTPNFPISYSNPTALYLGNELWGANPGTFDFPFNGSIDNVQVFNRALSAQEVMNLYNGTLANKSLKYSATQGDFKSGVFYNSTQTYWNISLSTADTTLRSGLVNPDNSINISNPNLVSYWALDGNYNDAKGVNNGTGIGTLNNATGISSGAIKAVGSSSNYLLVPNSRSINFTNNFSFSFWYSQAVYGGFDTIFAKTSNDIWSDGYGAYTTSGKMNLWITSYSTGKLVSATTLVANNIYHIVGTFNNNTRNMTIYINGVIDNSSILTYGISTNTGNLTLMWGRGVVAGYTGTLDEFILYNKTLSTSEIRQLYKSGLSQHANTNITIQTRTANNYNVSDPSLQLLYAFNNDSSIGENGTFFVDLSPKGNNGTFPGATGTINSSGIVANTFQSTTSTSNGGINTTNYVCANCSQMSISLWVMNTQSGQQKTYVTSANGAANVVATKKTDYEIFDWSDYSLFFQVGNGTSYYRAYYLPPNPLNIWHHVVGVYNGSKVIIYVDNVKTVGDSMTGFIYQNNSNTRIGERSTTNAAGLIDEVRIYNRSLSDAEVLDLYNLGSTHISDWSNGGNFTNETIATDSIGTLFSTAGKFMQFKAQLNTNTTDASPYVIGYNVSNYQGVSDTSYPIFFNNIDNSNNLTNSGVGYFNITVNNTNGTVLLHINSQVLQATNLTSNIYNVYYNFTNSGNYTYYWSSNGNGTSNLLNNSINYYYLIGNASINLISPQNNSYTYRSNNATLNVSLTGSSDHNWIATFYNATGNGVIGTVTGITTATIGVAIQLSNLIYGQLFNWYVSFTDGISTLISNIFSFTANDEPKIKNMRAEIINGSQIVFMWENEPDMSWISLFLGYDLREFRAITSLYANWTLSNVPTATEMQFRWQTADNKTAESDQYNFNIRTADWNPNFNNYNYRRLIIINSSLVGSDKDNTAINLTLDENNFVYCSFEWGGICYSYQPAFSLMNTTNYNDIRFSDYYNVLPLDYNITKLNIPGNGGQSTQQIPNDYSFNGNITNPYSGNDSDWNTFLTPNPGEISSIEYNFTIPANAKSSSQFRLQDGAGFLYDYAIDGYYWEGYTNVANECWGIAGSKLQFKTQFNRTNLESPIMNTYCRSQVDNQWKLIYTYQASYFYGVMMTWQYESKMNINLMPKHFNDSQQKNVNGVDGDYNTKLWMYYGSDNEINNETSINANEILNNVYNLGDQEGKSLTIPIITNLNDTKGRTSTGTNISWTVDQAVDNRLRYSTNPWILDSKFTNRIVNVTESFNQVLMYSNTTVKLILSYPDYLATINVTCTNSSYNSNYIVNSSKSPVELTFIGVQKNEYVDFNITYSENKSWERGTESPVFKLQDLDTNTQYWYEAIAYGQIGNTTSRGTFTLGSIASTPKSIILNYTEDRPNKNVTVCAQVNNFNGASSVQASIQYFNQTDTTFKETSSDTINSNGASITELAHYYLDDNLSNSDVIDSSGNGYTGTASTNTEILSTGGKINKAFNMGGTDNVVIPDLPIDNFTISVWVNLTGSNSNYENIVTTNGRGIHLNSYGGNHIGMFTGDGIAHMFSYFPNENEWVHLVATYDGTDYKMYANDVEQTEVISDTGYNPASQIGGHAYSTNNFEGLIDDVRIYDHALNSSDIDFIYNSEAGTQAGIAYGSILSSDKFCKEIPVNYGENNTFRVKVVGLNTGYSESYSNEFKNVQEFFVGNPAEDDYMDLHRQYCPALTDGQANITAKCYEETGYREGSVQEENFMYVETSDLNATILTLMEIYHAHQGNGIINATEVQNFTLLTSNDGLFKYFTINSSYIDAGHWYSVHMHNSTSGMELNWVKPGLTHKNNENRIDENIWVEFKGVPNKIDYLQFYFKNPGVYNTSSYRWCITQPGGNVYDCMSVQYWGTSGMSTALTGSQYDRGQFFRGGITNGEEKDSGLLQYSRTLDSTTQETDTLILADQRMCFLFTIYYFDESIIPTNNITNYYSRYWTNDQSWSDYLQITQDRTFNKWCLFQWKYDTIGATRDWSCLPNTEMTNENRVKTVTNTTFNSRYNESLLVGGKKDFQVNLDKDQIYESGFYTEGQWTNQQIGLYQQGFTIVNLPEKITNCSDDMAYARSDNANCTISANGCDIVTDSDSDSLSDCKELFVLHTNPKSNDTDEDKMLDGDEVANGYDPNIYLSHTASSISNLKPINQTLTSNNNINFSADAQSISGINTINLKINGIINTTWNFAQDVYTATVSTILNLADGIYDWIIEVIDNTGVISSESRQLTIDTTSPNITINTITTNAEFKVDNITIYWSSIDIHPDTKYFSIRNSTGTYFIYHDTSTYKILDAKIFNSTGNYTVEFFSNDTLGNAKLINSSFIISDTISPIVELMSPDDGATITSTNINFKFNVTDFNKISNCSLYYNNGKYMDSLSIANGENIISVVGIAGNHPLNRQDLNWNISCTDKSNNIGYSNQRSLIVKSVVTSDELISSPSNDKNPDHIDLTYQKEWTIGSTQEINMNIFNKNGELYTPTNISIEKIDGISLINVESNNDKSTIITIKLDDQISPGTKNMSIFINDERQLTAITSFKVVPKIALEENNYAYLAKIVLIGFGIMAFILILVVLIVLISNKK